MTPIVARLLPALLLIIFGTMAATLPLRAQDSALPEIKTQGDVTFLSGGIGSDETAAIKAAAPNYALTLQFSASTGAFLASVTVKITDAGGKVVLDTTAEGPYLLVNLAPGRYTIDAMLDGISRGTEVTIKAGTPQKRSLIWPPRKADAEPRTRPPAASSHSQSIVTTVPSMTTTAIISPSGAVTTTTNTPTTPTPAATATATTQDSLRAQVTAGGVPYITGGIGSDESAAIKAQFPKYALALTFASRQGGHNVFLASVPVQIRDASGSTMLDVTTGGPYLLVDLPPGKYEIVATYQGRAQRISVQVMAGKNSERAFSWSAP